MPAIVTAKRHADYINRPCTKEELMYVNNIDENVKANMTDTEYIRFITRFHILHDWAKQNGIPEYGF